MSISESKAKNYLPKSPLIKGLTFALFISFLAILLLAILFQVTSLSERYLGTMSSMVLFISVLGGGILAARAAEARFLFNGIGVGILYLLVIIAVSVFGGSSIGMIALGNKLVYCLGAGIMGGILGAFLK